jgi:hypothetical protein
MPELREQQREKLTRRDFAYVDPAGEGHLPIHDEAHTRNAIARWNQTAFASAADKEAARTKILRAAERHGIAVAPDDKIARPRA